MTTVLLAAVLLLAVIGVAGASVVAVYGSVNSTPLSVFIAGGVLLALKIVLAMLQTEFARRQILDDSKKTRHDIKESLNGTSLQVAAAAGEMHATAEELKRATNGGLQRAIETVAVKVRDAKDAPCAEHEGMPRTMEGLLALLDRHADKICGGMREVAKEAAEAAAARAVAELVKANPTLAGGAAPA